MSMDNTPATTTNKTTTDPSSGQSSEFLEPSKSSDGPQRRSSISKIVDAIKKPFHHEKKQEDVPPALKENIERMEERKQERIEEMQKEGLDTSMLEGSKKGQLKQTLR
ncbi:hypothetical protein DPSP01_013170 [Paraphaeosphaeria sporulosa]|uniref:Uncharacterized protein n=1 Tax=Paraphaeosphaeria sporulosa TaxID=1460663 RepID=A0A177BVZ0_9PLEO|nr:uncharacterized protein CC84DRAFT_1222680 [Paraphaeosphaeria sporulosa]OAF99663.1 hypothetical protein CC84DRAFT_1222680 [Paraphaeosphaeria sporulosa]